MRIASVVFAVFLIAAGPPRDGGDITPLCFFPAPTEPIMPPPIPPGALRAEKESELLDHHLAEWEKKITGVTSFRAEITLKRTDEVFKKETNFDGVVLCLKPGFFVMRLNNTGDPARNDYEAYIHDGKSIFAYNGIQKTITEIVLPPKPKTVNEIVLPPESPLLWPLNCLRPLDLPQLDLLTGMKAAEMKERYDVSLFKTDENYIYLDFKPRSEKDRGKFQRLRLALYGPGPVTVELAYLPAQVYLLKPHGDSEVWKFSNPQVNLPGIDEKMFKYVPVVGWKLLTPRPAKVEPIPLAQP